MKKFVTLGALSLAVALTGSSGQYPYPSTQSTRLDDDDLRKLKTVARVGTLDHIIAIDADTLGRGQILLVMGRATRTQWCLEADVYVRHRDSFKPVWSTGEGMSDAGICHETECPDPTARAVSKGEIVLVFPVLKGNSCEEHVHAFGWNGKTFVSKDTATPIAR